MRAALALACTILSALWLPFAVAAAILLLCLANIAHAQTPGVCQGISTSGPATINEASAQWVSLPCVPDALGGTGKGYRVRASNGGLVAWLWCPNATSWALRWSAMTWETAAPVLADIPAALVATDKRAALAQIEQTHLGQDIASPELKALWCPHWAAMQASKPQAARWVVAQAAYNASPPGTRPAFPWVNGARGTTSNGRAAQGSACNVAVGRVEGSTAYYGVNGRTDQVAVCVRVP